MREHGLEAASKLREWGEVHVAARCDFERRRRQCGFGNDREIAGPCGVLVNAAAVFASGELKTCRLPDGTVLAVNLTSCYLCAQAFGRQMRTRGRGYRSCTSPRSPAVFAGLRRRLQRQQGWRDHVLAPARERVGTAGHSGNVISLPAW